MESINRNARVVLTSHRLLRLCILLCTACNSMLSVRRISWRSLYMFGFAKRPNSAEKCDSSSSGDNCMPQIGQELWPVADVGPMCMGFLGPIPVGAKKGNFYTSIKSFLCPVHHQQHNQFFVNFQTTEYDFRPTDTHKKIREPIDAFLTATNGIVLLWLCRLYLHDRPKRDRNVQNGLNWNISSSANSFFCFNCIINFYCNPFSNNSSRKIEL